MMCGSTTRNVEQFPDINKLCNVASCWIYIGILLGAHPILHISRIRVNGRSTLIPTQTDDYFVCFGTMLAMAPKVASDFLDTVFTPVTTVTDVPMVTRVSTVTVLTRTHILFRSSLRCSEGVIGISNCKACLTNLHCILFTPLTVLCNVLHSSTSDRR
jgi:hypothetical protein